MMRATLNLAIFPRSGDGRLHPAGAEVASGVCDGFLDRPASSAAEIRRVPDRDEPHRSCVAIVRAGETLVMSVRERALPLYKVRPVFVKGAVLRNPTSCGLCGQTGSQTS